MTLSEYLHEMAELPDFCTLPDGADPQVNTVGNFGNTPLNVAAIQGNLGAVRLLVEAGAALDFQGEHGFTPLHDAIQQGHLDVARLLVELGASTGLLNDDGYDPKSLGELLGKEVDF